MKLNEGLSAFVMLVTGALLSFSAQAQRQASAVPTVVNGFVISITVIDGGSGYTNAPSVVISGGGGSGAVALATVLNGSVERVIVQNAGSGYTSGTPTVTIEAPPSSGMPSSDGLVAYYPFNGNANDESGMENNGNVVGATTTVDRFGKSDSAYQFPGSESTDVFIDLGHPPTLQFENDFTVTSWVLMSGAVVNPRIVSNGQDPGYELLTAGVSTSRRFEAHYASKQLFSSHYYPEGEWICVCLVRHGITLQLVINGVADGSTTITNSPSYNYNCQIGKKAQFDGHWGGIIDEVRFYNRALSAEELSDLYILDASPRINITPAVKLVHHDLMVGSDYQLQQSANLTDWTNFGAPFSAVANIATNYVDLAASSTFWRLMLISP